MTTEQQSPQTRSDQGKRVAPRFTTRYYRWMVTWALLVVAACVSMAVFDWPRGLTFGSVTVEDWSATLLLAVFAALWIVLVVRWERRLAARLRAVDYCLCPNCGYGMKGHTGETTCPECGRACDIEHAQRQWREYRPPPRTKK